MEKIIMQKGYGKTTQLIKKSAESGDYIVCHSFDEADRIKFSAKQMGLGIPLPITYAEFIEKRYHGRNISGFLIDNLEMFLQFLSNVPVNAVTMCPNAETKTVEQPASDEKTFEVVKCECGHVAPVEFSTVDENGCWTCPDCQKDFLLEQIEKLKNK